ncbi:Cytochrome c oxidase caa3 assembly factor [Bhargavaea cecembensis DSE10]|uniref:Cytochrome c oxidase caa3 assembly factor n=1 Tax=Bhargavaea cecembensis DSE10 TaxID=1235279 RepID=M7P600_9BACL|nr:cytochrome c oxidase assembly protein [Bhargavaea cecembensis]EMR05969.1 Cytochrome c oxidase caa3 assembly factor [Bhargavaea cecembensis DSE10]
MHHEQQFLPPALQVLIVLFALSGAAGYFTLMLRTNRVRRLKHWPAWRWILWLSGTVMAALVIAGPFAEAAHHDFRLHMAGHLLLGMLAPLLIALSAPVTLLLRALPVTAARRVTKMLRHPVARFYRNPITASVLNIGGLWLLYATPLFQLMHQHLWLYLLIHLHVFAAGYLFTISMIYIDPAPHPSSHLFRTLVFIFALAAHGILSKIIYAEPLPGFPPDEVREGAMLMYYGGDLVDLVIIILLFRSWYRATAPRHLYQKIESS